MREVGIMPTEPFLRLLSRERAVVDAASMIELAQPLLQELVNHACWAFHRCQAASDDLAGENEDTAAFTLYRHMIELSDGIEVLLSNSCVEASIPLLRALFEASLFLEYVLQDDYPRRGLSWVAGHIHARIKRHERMDRHTPQGAKFAEALAHDFPLSDDNERPVYASTEPIARLQSVLARPQFLEVEAEYARLRSPRRGEPNWFELFGGPRNRRQLAARINRESEYLGFYADWSGFTHGSDASSYIRPGPAPKIAAFMQVRAAHHLPMIASTAVGFLLRATRQMVEHFRSGEDLSRWYQREIKVPWEALRNLKITINYEDV